MAVALPASLRALSIVASSRYAKSRNSSFCEPFDAQGEKVAICWCATKFLHATCGLDGTLVNSRVEKRLYLVCQCLIGYFYWWRVS